MLYLLLLSIASCSVRLAILIVGDREHHVYFRANPVPHLVTMLHSESSGFWMTLVALVLLLLAGCTVCFGRRRDRMSGATTTSTYPAKGGIFSRFRRRY